MGARITMGMGRMGALLALTAIPWGVAAAQDCDAVNQTRVSLILYAAPPQFSTGGGWAFGDTVATVPAHTTIHICAVRSIGFWPAAKTWLKVRVELGKLMLSGWIAGQGTLISDLTDARLDRGWMAFLGPRVAYAQGTTAETPSGKPGSWPLYAGGFIAIIFGMAAKALFDRIQQGAQFQLSGYLLKTLPSLLVSPIVFLGFSREGDFVLVTAGSLAIYLCMAFQNGFFWQTILVKMGAPTPATLATPTP